MNATEQMKALVRTAQDELAKVSSKISVDGFWDNCRAAFNELGRVATQNAQEYDRRDAQVEELTKAAEQHRDQSQDLKLARDLLAAANQKIATYHAHPDVVAARIAERKRLAAEAAAHAKRLAAEAAEMAGEGQGEDEGDDAVTAGEIANKAPTE